MFFLFRCLGMLLTGHVHYNALILHITVDKPGVDKLFYITDNCKLFDFGLSFFCKFKNFYNLFDP